MRKRWKLLLTYMLTCWLLVMLVVSLLPSRYMAVGLVRVGFIGPGYGMLSLNTIATEAGSTGFGGGGGCALRGFGGGGLSPAWDLGVELSPFSGGGRSA